MLGIALLVGAALLSPAGIVRAQEAVLLPAGRLRLDLTSSLHVWNRRFGRRTEDGRLVEAVEPLGFDLTGDPVGSSMIPHLTELEASLRAALQAPGYRVRLGTTRALVEKRATTLPIRLEMGVTDWLTVGLTAPFVKRRTEAAVLFSADTLTADVGLSPAILAPAEVGAFLDAFGAALEGAGTVGPVQEARSFLEALRAAYMHGTVFPLAGSDAARVLTARLQGLRTALEGIGIQGVPTSLPLARDPLDGASFARLLEDPAFGIALDPLGDWESRWELGDVEVSGAMRLLAGVRGDTLDPVPSLRYLLGAGLLVRLGTGSVDSPSNVLDLGSGNGQTDVEGRLFGEVEVRGRFGVWGDLRYGIQRPVRLDRRIAPPGAPLAPRRWLVTVRWTPGSYLQAVVAPWLRLGEGLTVAGTYRLRTKGTDRYEHVITDPQVLDVLNLPPLDVLEEETRETLHEVGISATFSTLPAHARGEARLPFRLRFAYLTAVAGSGGRTPKGSRMEFGVSLFRRFWGGDGDGGAP